MMYFYENNYEDVCNFARRRKQDALHWANTYNSLDYIEGAEPQDLLENLKRCLARIVMLQQPLFIGEGV